MDCTTLHDLLLAIADPDAVGRGEWTAPAGADLQEAVQAGWIAVEEAADPVADDDFEAQRERTRKAGERLRELRARATGLSPDDALWERVAVAEREANLARSHLLDVAAERQRRASSLGQGPGHRLTWKGRELLDELQARAWRLRGVPAEDFEAELRELRQALRARAEGGRRMDEALARARPSLPELDRRAVALSLAESSPFPEREADRVKGLVRALDVLGLAMGEAPPELAALIAVHEHRDAILHASVGASPLRILALALVPEAPTSGANDREVALLALATSLARSRGADEPGASDVVLAAAGLPAERLEARKALLAGVQPAVPDKDEAAAVAGLLLLADAPPADTLQRWSALSQALGALYQGPAALPAALLSLVDGPQEEVLDDLRLAAEEIDRADLAVSALEALVQGTRLLLSTALAPLTPRLLPTTSWATQQVKTTGMQLRLPAALASARLGLLVDAAVYRGVRRSYRVYHRSHPAHRSGGFHG